MRTMRRWTKTRIYDTLHHAVVYCCMAVSAAAMFDIGYIGYQYYVHIKPARKAEQLRLQQELLEEGTAPTTTNISSQSV